VVECFDEACNDLFAFLWLPKSQGKSMPKECVERISGKRRRRPKPQASLLAKKAHVAALHVGRGHDGGSWNGNLAANLLQVTRR
jgi:hypothetical protein